MKEVFKNILRPPARIVFNSLSWVENLISSNYQLRYNPVFIIGPPRSGSTLLYLLTTYALSSSYFTNLTGRLRVQGSLALPIFTAKFSKLFNLMDNRRETFESYYGFGKGWGGPYNGLKIWSQWLSDGYVGTGKLSVRAKQQIYQTVAATERVINRPFINKEQNNSMRIQALNEVFPQAIFIQCLRDPLAVAQSIYIARTRDFPYLPAKPKDPAKAWFSCKPKEFPQIKDKSLIEQVCEQVYYIEQNMADDRTIIGEERFLFVEYKDLCRKPHVEVNKIAQFMNNHNAPTQIIRPIPASFNYSSGRKINKADYRAMVSYLEKLYARPMEVDGD